MIKAPTCEVSSRAPSRDELVKRKRKIEMEGQERSRAGSRDGPVSAVLWSQRLAPRSNNKEECFL